MFVAKELMVTDDKRGPDDHTSEETSTVATAS
jgi:hypothetical protein